MKRRQRHLALPKTESKVVTENKRTICTTLESSNSNSNIFEPRQKPLTKK